MLPEELEKPLASIERQLEEVSEALGQGDPARFEAAGTNLRKISIELAQLTHDGHAALADAEARQRLQRIAGLMAAQREGLARQAAMVERALGVLLPSTRHSPTYNRPAGLARYTP